MTRRCGVAKLDLDLPCDRRAPHWVKIVSKHIGNKGKYKIWLCDFHYKLIASREYVGDVLNPEGESTLEESEKYRARLSR
jgi:hypothetical protein